MRTVLLIAVAALLALGCATTKSNNVKVSKKSLPTVVKHTASVGSGQSAVLQQEAQERVEEARPQMVGQLNSLANTEPQGRTKVTAKQAKKVQMKKPVEHVTRRVKQNRMPGKGLVAPRESTGNGTSDRFVTRRIKQSRMPGKGLISPRENAANGGTAEQFVTRRIKQGRMPGKGLITPRMADPEREANTYTGGQAKYRFKGHDKANLAD